MVGLRNAGGLRNLTVDCARRRIWGRPLGGGSIPPISTIPPWASVGSPGWLSSVAAVVHELLKVDPSMGMLCAFRLKINRHLRTVHMLQRRHRLDNQGLRGSVLPPYPSAHSPSVKWCSHWGHDLSRSCNGMVRPTVSWGHFRGG